MLGDRRITVPAVLAAVAAMFISLVVMARAGQTATAPTPQATTQAFATGRLGPALRVTGAVPGHAAFASSTGLFEINIEGKTSYAYCIDVLAPLLKGAGEPMDATPWSAANIAHLSNIQRILQEHPAEATIARSQTDSIGASREAAAVQSAIWHFSDNYEFQSATTLDRATDETATVKALYDQIVADATAHPAGEPKAALTVSPATASANAGQEAGPFTIATTATSPLALAVSGGSAEIRNCTTHAVKTTAVDGDKVCLFRSTAGGPITLTVSGNAPEDAGRVFVNKVHESQEIILAGTKTVPVDAAVKATFAEVGGTTTTTTPGSTTTTTPGSTTTTTPGSTTSTTQPGTTPSPAITIRKTAAPTQVQGPATVTFTYVITNTGNTPLTIISLHDDHGTPSNIADDLPIGSFTGCDLVTPLAPSASITCTLAYDLPAVQVMTSQTNTVAVVGKPPTGSNVSATSQATVVNTPPPVTVLAEQTPAQATPAAQTPAQVVPVQQTPSTLPFTGSNAAMIAALAFALLSLGTFVVGLSMPAANEAERRRQ